MEKKLPSIICLFCFFAVGNVLFTQENIADHGLYFNLKPPGQIPEVFAPGFISTEAWEAAGTFSPDGREYFFTRRPTEQGRENRLYHTRLKGGKWTTPSLASFAVDIFEMEPHITPSGDRLFFNSERPKPPGVTMKGDIWLSRKTDGKWSEPSYLNSSVNDGFAMYVSATRDGTIYYTGSYNRKYGIFKSKPAGDIYGPPEYLPSSINGIGHASHPFIAPDESYIIFDIQISGPLKPELFISFHRDDGTWTEAVNMGSVINAQKTEFGASVSPDGKYMFFHRTVDGNGDIYWVDASVIKDLRSQSSL